MFVLNDILNYQFMNKELNDISIFRYKTFENKLPHVITLVNKDRGYI